MQLHRELAQSFAVSNLDTQLSFMLAFAVASGLFQNHYSGKVNSMDL
jgi:hypothetical protein